MTAVQLDLALNLMARLYAEDSGAFNRERARRASQYLLEHPEYGAIWLIQVGGQTIGYVVLTLGYSLEFDGQFGLLDELYIEGPWRGQGIGTEALAFVERECRARGLAAVRLEVAHRNTGALQLYRRAGFETHDRHLMTKWLYAARD
jgi:ribosomal protein S18 acetylase RimI-like enzyme